MVKEMTIIFSCYKKRDIANPICPSISFHVNCCAPGKPAQDLPSALSASPLQPYCQLRHYTLSLKILNGLTLPAHLQGFWHKTSSQEKKKVKMFLAPQFGLLELNARESETHHSGWECFYSHTPD